MPENNLCHCGQPLHYSSPAIQASVERIIAERGEKVEVSARGRTWLVPRHYIALHGLQEEHLPTLKFEEKK